MRLRLFRFVHNRINHEHESQKCDGGRDDDPAYAEYIGIVGGFGRTGTEHQCETDDHQQECGGDEQEVLLTECKLFLFFLCSLSGATDVIFFLIAIVYNRLDIVKCIPVHFDISVHGEICRDCRQYDTEQQYAAVGEQQQFYG